jgi:type IV secretory pathway TraG/TraD family ATPase VirD4
MAKTQTFSLKNQKVFGTLILNDLVNFFDNRGESFRYAGDSKKRKKWNPFFLYVDEFQRYLTSDIGEVLAGGRKFGFHMIMANQTFSQLDEKTREEINNIASAKAYFAVKDMNIAMDIWRQSGVYKAEIKETIRKFQTIDDGYSHNTTFSVSTNSIGQETVTKSQQAMKQSRTIEYDDNKYYSEQETALMEGKKIQQMKPRHFLFTSDGMPEGNILKTEWCFDIECRDEEIKKFHKYLADKNPELYFKVDDLKKELRKITHPHSKEYDNDEKEFLANGKAETVEVVYGKNEDVGEDESLFN